MKLTSSNPSMNEALSTMDYPEYRLLFSNEGEYIVEVKFEKDKISPINGRVTNLQASISDITQLLELLSLHRSRINIDDYPCFVKSIQIDPTLKTIRLNVRLTEGHDK